MKKIIIALAFITSLGKANAQIDPHFSQYYIYPSWLNPALTGAIDGDYRISGIYRSQWAGVANGFSTVGLSGELVTNKNINIGGSFLRQNAGTGGYNYNTGYISVAYTGIKFGAEGHQKVVFGVQGGIISRKFDQSKFTTDNQWTTVGGFDPSIPVNESLGKTSATTFDVGAGVLYYDAKPNKTANVFLGFSANHLTQPEDKFAKSSGGTVTSKLPIRYTIHGGVKLKMSETVTLTPNLLYLRQGQAEEKMVGAHVQVQATENTDLLIGANYRFKDAISPFVGFYYKNFVLGAAYDINNSDLRKSISGNTNSFEISLSYTGKRSKELAGKHFICPRL